MTYDFGNDEPPNEYVPSPMARMAEWLDVVNAELRKDGRKPDDYRLCYAGQTGDRMADISGDFADVAVGAYKQDQFIRFVLGENDKPSQGVSSFDLKFSEVKLLILRQRKSPRWQHPRPNRNGEYPYYDFYWQTRIYTATTASYAPKGLESRTRLMDAPYIFDWLCRVTGAPHVKDTQFVPLEGYPEGV